MKPFALLTLLVVSAVSSFAGREAAKPGPALAAIVRSADAVEIEYYMRNGRETVNFSDPAWLASLAHALEGGTYAPRSHCFCISFPQITLLKNGKKIAGLGVHHDTKLRVYAGTINGDFEVGESLGNIVNRLALERKADATQKPTKHEGSES